MTSARKQLRRWFTDQGATTWLDVDRDQGLNDLWEATADPSPGPLWPEWQHPIFLHHLFRQFVGDNLIPIPPIARRIEAMTGVPADDWPKSEDEQRADEVVGNPGVAWDRWQHGRIIRAAKVAAAEVVAERPSHIRAIGEDIVQAIVEWAGQLDHEPKMREYLGKDTRTLMLRRFKGLAKDYLDGDLNGPVTYYDSSKLQELLEDNPSLDAPLDPDLVGVGTPWFEDTGRLRIVLVDTLDPDTEGGRHGSHEEDLTRALDRMPYINPRQSKDLVDMAAHAVFAGIGRDTERDLKSLRKARDAGEEAVRAWAVEHAPDLDRLNSAMRRSVSFDYAGLKGVWESKNAEAARDRTHRALAALQEQLKYWNGAGGYTGPRFGPVENRTEPVAA